jgi:hypothetical protein
MNQSNYIRLLEAENAALIAQVKALQAQLKQHGVTVTTAGGTGGGDSGGGPGEEDRPPGP